MSRLATTLTLPDPDATTALAHHIAPMLGAGDVILLQGPIGAGKSHFARALIQARLGRAEDVPSPTFTLVQTYQADGVDVWHADLYRLTDAAEVDELGLTQAFDEAITLVEWPDRLGHFQPHKALMLELTPDATGDVRRAHLTADDPRWGVVFQALSRWPDA